MKYGITERLDPAVLEWANRLHVALLRELYALQLHEGRGPTLQDVVYVASRLGPPGPRSASSAPQVPDPLPGSNEGAAGAPGPTG